MRILDANTLTPDIKELLLELISKIEKVEQSPKELKVWLALNLGTDIFGAWIVIDDNEEPVGVLTCEIIEQNIEPRVFISFCWVRPDLDYFSDLLAKCEKWTKEKGIKKMLTYTKRRNWRGLEKKYGFNLQKIILTKELK